MSVVYVVQNTLRRRVDSLVPCKDLSPAAAFGELRVLYEAHRAAGAAGLPTKNAGKFYSDMVDRLWDAGLRDYTQDDYLLPIGDPAAIAAAGALAALAGNGKFRMLCWDNRYNEYHVAELTLWDDDADTEPSPS